MTTPTLALPDLLELLQPDLQAIEDGRRRMHDIWHDRATDSLPIIFGAPPPTGVAAGRDMVQHFEDPDVMLYDSVAGLLGLARAGSDAQLAIRADTGTGTLATIAGCKLLPSEFALPWTTHLTREQVAAFEPEAMDLAQAGVMPRVRDLYAAFRQQLPDCVHFFCADTQSPFDLAHLLYGDALFYELYDDPDFIHDLLRKATYLYIEGTKLLKTWVDEPLDGGYHFNMAIANGGSRACEDTATLLSKDAITEFVHPYRMQGLAPFGGGFLHYCGNNDHLLASALADPTLRGINFGNPERHDFAVIIPALIEAGKCYWGLIDRKEDETLDAYFRRVIGYTGGARKGLIFSPVLTAEDSAEPARVLDTWRSLQ